MGFTVESCCCFELKTGGLIIGYIELLLNVIGFLIGFGDAFSTKYFARLLMLAVAVAWVYGIHENKPSFMVASMIASFIGVVAIAIIMITLTISTIFGLAFIHSLIPPESYSSYSNGSHDVQNVETVFLAIMWITIMLLALAFALSWYLFQVKASLYQNMTRLQSVANPHSSDISGIEFGKN